MARSYTRNPPQCRKRVSDMVARRGLLGLSAYDVSLLLDRQPEAMPFQACFKMRKASVHALCTCMWVFVATSVVFGHKCHVYKSG